MYVYLSLERAVFYSEKDFELTESKQQQYNNSFSVL